MSNFHHPRPSMTSIPGPKEAAQSSTRGPWRIVANSPGRSGRLETPDSRFLPRPVKSSSQALGSCLRPAAPHSSSTPHSTPQPLQPPSSSLSSTTSRARRDLFRAFLDVRPHGDKGNENEQYSRIEKIGPGAANGNSGSSTSASAAANGSSSGGGSGEFFVGSYGGAHANGVLLKVRRPDPPPSTTGGSPKSTGDDAGNRGREADRLVGEPVVFCTGSERSCIRLGTFRERPGASHFETSELPFRPQKRYYRYDSSSSSNDHSDRNRCCQLRGRASDIFGEARRDRNATCNNNDSSCSSSGSTATFFNPSPSSFSPSHPSHPSAVADNEATLASDRRPGERNAPADLYRIVTGPTRCSAWLSENECSRRVMGSSTPSTPSAPSAELDDLARKMDASFRPQKRQFARQPSTCFDFAREQEEEEEKEEEEEDDGEEEEDEEDDEEGQGGALEKIAGLPGCAGRGSQRPDFSDPPLSATTSRTNRKTPSEKRGSRRKRTTTKTKMRREGGEKPKDDKCCSDPLLLMHSLDTRPGQGRPGGEEMRSCIMIRRDDQGRPKQAAGVQRSAKNAKVERSECGWFRNGLVCSGDRKIVDWPECKFNFRV